MATTSISVSSSYDSELGRFLVSSSPPSHSGSRINLVRGDYARITHYGSGHSSALKVSFPSAHFSGTLVVYLSPGQSVSRLVKSDAPLTGSSVLCTLQGQSTRIYYTAVEAVDSYPDAFSFSSVLNSDPDQPYISDKIILSGINTTVTASVSGYGVEISVRGADYTTLNRTVKAGDWIRLRMTSGVNYGDDRTATLTIGGRSATWLVANKDTPDPGAIIPFPILSGRIKISDIKNFFGGSYKLGDYVRGGLYIADNVPQNDSVKSTKANMKFSDYYGTALSLYFKTIPKSKVVNFNTNSGGATFTLSTNKISDFTLGYSTSMATVAQVRYTVVSVEVYGLNTSASDVSTTVTGGSLGVWSSSVLSIKSTVTVPAVVERDYKVTIKVEIRHPSYTSFVESKLVTHTFQFSGP